MQTYIELDELTGAMTATQMRAIMRDVASEEERDENFQSYIRQATSVVNSYIARRYDIPNALEVSPPVLEYRTLSLSKYFALNRVSSVSDVVASQYSDTIDWLKMVAEGRIDIFELEDDKARSRFGYGMRDREINIEDTATNF